MNRALSKVCFTSLRVFGYVVVGLMSAAILYAGITALLNWTQIAV